MEKKIRVHELKRGDIVPMVGGDKTYVTQSDFRNIKTGDASFFACTLHFTDRTKMTYPADDYITIREQQ